MEQVKKEEEQEVLKCFYRTVRAVKIERTSGADFSAPRNGFMVDLYNIVFFSFLFLHTLRCIKIFTARTPASFFFIYLRWNIWRDTKIECLFEKCDFSILILLVSYYLCANLQHISLSFCMEFLYRDVNVTGKIIG